MTEIKLTKRYPNSRIEDITDAYMRGWNDALDAVQNGKFHIAEQTEPICENCKWAEVEWADEPCENCCKNNSGFEPKQTDPSTEAITGLPGPCIGCEKHICAGCDFQKAKEAWRKSQADCAWK